MHPQYPPNASPGSSSVSTVAERLRSVREALLWLRAGVALVTAGASRGKTNLLCDLAASSLPVWAVPCAFLSARDLEVDAAGHIDDSFASVLCARRPTPPLDEILDGLCEAAQAVDRPFILLVDGLNEHRDLARFPKALANLLDRLTAKPGLRVLLACRSEHLAVRFRELLQSFSAAEIARLEEPVRQLSGPQKRLLLDNYFRCFHLDAGALSDSVRERLAEDPLLLRIFCEVEGSREGPVLALPPRADIHKARLFAEYVRQRSDLMARRQGRAVGVTTSLYSVADAAGALMLERRRFDCVPLSALAGRTSPEALRAVLDEDLLLCTDSPGADDGLLLSDPEVVRFAMDEFGDFVLARLIVQWWVGADRAKAVALVAELVEARSPVSEGLARFLFHEARQSDRSEFRAWVEAQAWHDEAFLECVFALAEEQVDQGDAAVAQYRGCVDAGACTAPEEGDLNNWGRSARDCHPINGVTWEQARAFCRWAGGRLPSEAEWEYAARSGGRAQTYPWGDEEPTCARSVMFDRGRPAGERHARGRDSTWPVCSKPLGSTLQGLCDMAGNVWEWVEDVYVPSYDGAPRDGSARQAVEDVYVPSGDGSGSARPRQAGSNRVLRGGARWGDASGLRAAHRVGGPGDAGDGRGFRCAR